MLTFSTKGKTFTVDAVCWKQITVIEDSITDQDIYEFNIILFGLTNILAIFQ